MKKPVSEQSIYRSYIGLKTMSFLRQRKKVTDFSSYEPIIEEEDKKTRHNTSVRYGSKKWSCWDNCCWFIGFLCSMWWLLLFLYNAMPASLPQYLTEAITGPMPDPPGVKLRKEGLMVNHPVVFVPGIVTGGLELWEGRQCAEDLLGKRIWGGSFGEFYKR